MRYPHKQQGFSNLQPLTYDKLNRDKREIRLLTIHPGSWRARIRCTLTTASLNDNPVYNALSYVWGNPHDTVPIFVDGKAFHATINLWRALRRVRRPTAPFTLWIDAICINQRDAAEKSWQVSTMGAIYAHCLWTIVWLGEDPHARQRRRRPRPRPKSKPFRLATQLLTILAEDRHYADHPCYELTDAGIQVTPRYRPHFAALRALLAADWWRRIWVVQELVLPPRVVFVAASATFNVPVVERAYVRAGKHGTDCCRWAWQELHAPAPSGAFFQAVVDLLAVFAPFATAAFYRLPGSQLSLRTLRQTCGAMRATVPQDQVYGVLGLVTSWGEAGPPVPDYEGSVAEAVVRAVLCMVEQEGSFCALHGSRDLEGREGVPSWVPDYAMGHDHTSTRYPLLESFKASDSCFERPSLVDGSVLQVKAVGVDQVEKVGRAVTNPDTLWTALEEWKEIMGADGAGRKSEPKMEQFWNALLRATLSSNKLRQTYGWDWSDVSWSECEEDYQRFREACTSHDDSKGPAVSLLAPHKTGASYKEAVSKKMFFTKAGRFGLARYSVEVGDEIYLPIGAKAPFVLRKVATSDSNISNGSLRITYQVVSECFLEGVMDGELIKRGDWKNTLEDILFV